MRTTRTLCAMAPLALLSACELAEIREARRADASMVAGTADAADPPVQGEPDASVDASVDGAPAPNDNTIPPGAMLGSCDPLRWTASASGQDPSDHPGHAIDALPPSRWSSGAAQSPGMYYQLDFGGFVQIKQIALEHVYATDGVGDHPRAVDVLGSRDGNAYDATLHHAAFPDDPGTATLDFSSAAVRGVRLSLTESASPSWWTIHELRVDCRVPDVAADAGVDADLQIDAQLPSTGVDPNRAQWTATASHTAGGDVASRAIDASDTTRWATGKSQRGDESIRLDLGIAATVREVWLTSRTGDGPAAYALDVSTDDQAYTTVALGLGSDITRISFPARSARYLRVRQIGAGYGHWWTVYDINVVSVP